MIQWTDLLAVVLLSVVALLLLRIAHRRKYFHREMYRLCQNPFHLEKERRSRQIELGLKILLPLVWILILLALVQG